MVNFTDKLSTKRPIQSQFVGNAEAPPNLETALESDRGRIVHSAPIRRLQQKTQVFPLERNAEVRSRLTHSLEVQQTGRFITREIFKLLHEQGEYYGLKGYEREVETLVEMACLMHDMGNPPFGHFGEMALSQWFQQMLPQTYLGQHQFSPHLQPLATKLQRELNEFEGNAQAIRIIVHLQRLNLTYAQVACVLKYTRIGTAEKPTPNDPLAALKKKPGFYLSEQDYVQQLWHELQIQAEHRYPFTYIMEAADDISYCLADLEDGVDKGLLSYQELCEQLVQAFNEQGQQGKPAHDANTVCLSGLSFQHILNQALIRAEQEPVDKNHAFFIQFRVGLIHSLVQHAAQAFVDQLEAVYQGCLPHALLEDKSPQHTVIVSLKQVARRFIFSTAEVETLELQGYRILRGILDGYKPLLELTQRDFTALVHGQGSAFLVEGHLVRRLPALYVKAYRQHCQHFPEQATDEEKALWEFYYRCRLLQDVVSSLTDQAALDEYQVLHALLPH